jgi:hypothetical protein
MGFMGGSFATGWHMTAKAGAQQLDARYNLDTHGGSAFLLNGIVEKPPCTRAEWRVHCRFILQKAKRSKTPANGDDGRDNVALNSHGTISS